ncbi:PAS domain S-box-containing protein [Maridesulfovibrio ferrireducens]|uniref:PAS domain S-box-containing protein n=1 Tax=Maridesulfovibrio ferrireducens TaxID=246191 RepID=A0A1G9EVC6_9BACT|nr:PAS domain S-box protein [Maridesulfovibrio ferrireducens]SDK80031.1 PAS domain S-box-containing protein [Maridesulfovibrio ferrireducens]
MKIKELLENKAKPVIVADINGIITSINESFTREFGWTENELKGKPLTAIIPKPLRDAHQLGFSAYLSTGKASILGQHLDLEIAKSDGTVESAKHFIISEIVNEKHSFAATIEPRNKE